MTGFWQPVISRIDFRMPNVASVDRRSQSIFLSFVATLRTVLSEMLMERPLLQRQENAVGPRAGLQSGEHRTITEDSFEISWLTSVHQPQMLLKPLRDYVHMVTLGTEVSHVFGLMLQEVVRPHF